MIRFSAHGQKSSREQCNTPQSGSETNLCVLKPDELDCAVNTILINHLLEDDMESSDGGVGNAYTPVDNGVYRE